MPLTPAMYRKKQLAEHTLRPVRVSVRERSYSEEAITPETAITSSGAVAIIIIISQDLSSLPLLLYARRGRNKYRAYDSLYYRLMHDQPNPEQTSVVFRELIVGHMIGWGNFYAQPIFDKRGDVQELWPLRPDRMTVERKNGERIYTYQTADGKPRIFFDDEILHIPAWGFDGLVGYSRIAIARNAIGLAISTEKYGSKFFSNGANFDIAVTHPATLSDTAYDHLSKSFEEKHVGVENSHKPLILEENMSIEKIGIPPDDAQFLETRKFQLAEINRILGPVPPHMLGDVERSTSWGTGIDSQEQGYINHTLRPYAVRIEQALNLRLLMRSERERGYFYEHLFDGLLRGDIQTRFEAYVKAINNGIMSPNEVRSKENLNPYNGGDRYWQPLNMVASDGGNNTDQGSTENALSPLWRDAMTRAMKREQNDVTGAWKRFDKKGDAVGFREWATNFYQADQPTFVKKQLSPVIRAHAKLYGQDLGSMLESETSSFMAKRLELVLSASQLEDIEAMMESSEETVRSFVDFIGKLYGEEENEVVAV